MMNLLLILILSFALFSLIEAKDIDYTEDSCGLYLAESSVKNAGWGVFAGKDFGWGDRMVRLLHAETVRRENHYIGV